MSKTDVKRIPLEVLFGNPVKTSPKISPDGLKMAYIAPDGGVLNVWLKTIGTEDDRVVTNDTNRGIRHFVWAAEGSQILYVQDKGGDENWRLYGVGLTSGKLSDFTPFDNVQVNLKSVSKRYPDKVIIEMNKENPQLHDVYQLDITTGEILMIEKNPGNVAGWTVDINLKVNGAVVTTDDGGSKFLVKNDVSGEWEEFVCWGPEDALNSGPVSFTGDGKSVYLLDSRGFNSARLKKVGLETKEEVIIAEDPEYDADSILLNPDTYEVQAVSFEKYRNEWVIIDESIKEDFDNLKELAAGDFSIFSRDKENKKWIAGYSQDNGPVSFYSYDRETKKSEFIFYNKPDLRDYEMAPMEEISFRTRDGLTVHGYITFPVGVERKNLPVVLNVHGGPWHRDSWGYDAEAQWFANRGYVCLQVNYRGSTGYGKNFLNAADKEWGGRMHDDLIDAVNALINDGTADPERVAIYGGSYGGYAALVGAAFTPDVFCCSVAIVGPSNLITFINTIPPYWSTFKSMMYKRVGNPETEVEFLKSRSPLYKVDNIKIPMLIAQGANDPRVKQSESEQIVEAMEKKGIDHEYMLFPDEGHGFAKPENRLKFYSKAEDFLGKYLAGE